MGLQAQAGDMAYPDPSIAAARAQMLCVINTDIDPRKGCHLWQRPRLNESRRMNIPSRTQGLC